MDLVCLGEIILDMFGLEVGRGLTEVSAFRPLPGGAPANIAVAAARLGRPSAFIGKVGDDPFGRYLAGVLAGEGVDTRGLAFDREARTTLNFIALPEPNTAEFLFYRHPGADMRLQADELDRALIRSARAFHFGSLSLAAEPCYGASLAAIDLAVRAGALISFDVNYRPTLWPDPATARTRILATLPRANVLKVNAAELLFLTGMVEVETASAALVLLGPDLVVVTLGAQGSYFRLNRGGAAVPGFQVEAVDASGCGDAFTAALLCRLLEGDDWRANLTPDRLVQALRYANAAGALTARKQGVIPALPTASEVELFLSQ